MGGGVFRVLSHWKGRNGFAWHDGKGLDSYCDVDNVIWVTRKCTVNLAYNRCCSSHSGGLT